MLGVKPVMGKRLARSPFALSDLVLVVGENKIDSARVYIKSLAKIAHRHSRAFQMPARTAFAIGRRPVRLSRTRRFPECEIARILLIVLINIYSCPCYITSQLKARELAVGFKRSDPVID